MYSDALSTFYLLVMHISNCCDKYFIYKNISSVRLTRKIFEYSWTRSENTPTRCCCFLQRGQSGWSKMSWPPDDYCQLVRNITDLVFTAHVEYWHGFNAAITQTGKSSEVCLLRAYSSHGVNRLRVIYTAANRDFFCHVFLTRMYPHARQR